MPATRLTGLQVKDNSIQRADLDVGTSGQAVITKALSASSLRLVASSTGADAGTGDVTFDLAQTGVGAGTYVKVTVDVYGRVTGSSTLSAGDIPDISATYLLRAGGTMSGPLVAASSSVSQSGLRIPAGTAPSSPVNGDLWNSTNVLKFYNGSIVTTVATLELANSWSQKQTFVSSTSSTASLNIPFGAAPSSPTSGDVWGAGSSLFYYDGSIRTFANLESTQTFSGAKTFSGNVVTLAPASTTYASLNIGPGTAPTTPASGDIWNSGTDLKFYDGSTTNTLLTTGNIGSSVIQNQNSAAQATSNFWISGVGSANELRAYDTAATHYVAIKAQATGMTSSYTFVMPAGYGGANGLLATDGAGVLSWTNSPIFTNSIVDNAAGTARSTIYRTTGVARVYIGVDTTAETGSNAGSNFNIILCNDAGAGIETIISAARPAGSTINLGGTGRRTVALSGMMTMGITAATISQDTSDASDTRSITIAGGGAAGISRGGYITVTGNEKTTDGGNIWLQGGDNSTYGAVMIATGNPSTVALKVAYDGTVSFPRMTGSGVRVLNLDASGIMSARALAQADITGLTNTSTPVFGSVYANGASGTLRGFYIQSSASDRWHIRGNADAESGSDAGTALEILARSDAGSLIDAVFKAERKSGGLITLGQTGRPVAIGGPVSLASTIKQQKPSATVSLIHFDGKSGSRQIIDLGGYRWNSVASPLAATLTTAQTKFGVSSLLLNGTSQFIELEGTNYSAWNFGTGAFTVECQLFFNSVTGTQTILDAGGTAAGLVVRYVAGTGLQLVIAGTTTNFAWSPSTSTWYHVAVVRSGTSVYAWVAGAQIGTTQTSAGSIAVGSNAPTVGASGRLNGTAIPSNFLSAYIDEFVVSNTAKWTSGFTAPTSAYDYVSYSQIPGSANDPIDAGMTLVSDASGNSSLQSPRRVFVANFALTENVANTTKYFYAWRGAGATQEDAKRSGNTNGLANANGCSPIQLPFNGRIVKAILNVQGTGVNQSSATYPCSYQVQLYRVGWTTEHDATINSGSPVQINFPLYSGVGGFSVGATNAKSERTDIGITVNAGDMLGLKFLNGATAALVGITQMAFVSFVIEEVM